jgi:hypothetical protein
MIDDDFDPDWKAERDRADEEFLNESPERRQKREERDQLLVKAAELTMELREWEHWLFSCLMAWEFAAVDDPEIRTTWDMAVRQLRHFWPTLDPKKLEH